MATTPLTWYGGKRYLLPTLLKLLPAHHTYVEVFGGSGALLFAKPPSPVEVYNDLDSGLVHFFRVLRNSEQAAELRRLLDLTPYSREEYYDCVQTWHDTDEPIERARRWFVDARMSINQHLGQGWSYNLTYGRAGVFRTATAQIPDAVERLRDVQIDNRPAVQVIQACDSPQTLFYLDPPYVLSTRSGGKAYQHEMADDDHVKLLDLLQGIEGMAILSGYHSELYDARLTNWQCIEVAMVARSIGVVRATGKDSKADDAKRTESIWLNPATQEANSRRQMSLFDCVPVHESEAAS